MQAKSKPSGFLGTIRRYLRRIVFSVNIIALIFLFISTRAWGIAPSEYSLVAYIGLGFPILMAINVLFLILWCIVLKWRFILANIAVFTILWNPISTYYPMHMQTDNVPEDCIKLVSYNVKGFNYLKGDQARTNPIFNYIKEQNPDIICLQEFITAIHKNTKKGLISQEEFNEIFKEFPYRSIIRMGDTHASHIYGVVCYSKYPIIKSNRIDLPQSTYNGAAIHELEIKGKKVTIVNNHLESNRITAEDKKLYYQLFDQKDGKTLDKVAHNIHERLSIAFDKREHQVHVIREELAKQNTEATIICGDFNDTAMSYAYKVMKGDLIDSYAETGFGPGVTFNENMFLFRIDFIFHSDNMESFNATVGSEKLSDHYPISTYLRFK